MTGGRAALATVLLLGCSCASHSFYLEQRFMEGDAWEPQCDALQQAEEEGRPWSLSHRQSPYLLADLYPNAGIWVLDVKEYASRGLESRAEDRQLQSVVLRCGEDAPVTLPAVACVAPETYFYGWASSGTRSGTRIYVDASGLASGGSRGTTEQPCELVAEIRYGTRSDQARARVLVRSELTQWAHYLHAR